MTLPTPFHTLLSVACLTGLAAAQVQDTGTQKPGQDPAAPLAAAGFGYDQARHLLMRAGFGGTPAEIEKLQRMGLTAAVRHLVDYESTPALPIDHGVLPAPPIKRDELRGKNEEERMRVFIGRLVRDQQRNGRLRGWWISRMVQSQRPLEERMTLFWHGHFTSGYREVRNAYHMALQNNLLRDHATGNFEELVRDISRDPAMLRYLDNNRNKRRAPNENYARELMELFTLGEGEYTEKDIKEAARAFTGWTFGRGRSEFRFNRRDHDFGKKKFLGREGNFDGHDIITIILEQKAAPRYVAGKILQYFAVKPTAAEIEPYARLLQRSNWEIKPVLRKLFSSQWFYSKRVVGRQVKSPVALAVSTLKMLGVRKIDSGTGSQLAGACARIGQSLLQPPNVKGWDGGTAWVTTSNLLSRYNVTRQLVGDNSSGSASSSSRRNRGRGQRRRPGGRGRGGGLGRARLTGRIDLFGVLESKKVTTPVAIVRELEKRFLVMPLSEARRAALVDFLAGKNGATALDMNNRRRATAKLQELLYLLTTTPEFQLS